MAACPGCAPSLRDSGAVSRLDHVSIRTALEHVTDCQGGNLLRER